MTGGVSVATAPDASCRWPGGASGTLGDTCGAAPQDDDDNENGAPTVEAVKIGLQVVLVLAGLFLTLLILLHKGKGGGLSDMFGGGMSSAMGGSSVAERNLDRFTVAVGLVWAAAIVGLGLIERFSS